MLWARPCVYRKDFRWNTLGPLYQINVITKTHDKVFLCVCDWNDAVCNVIKSIYTDVKVKLPFPRRYEACFFTVDDIQHIS